MSLDALKVRIGADIKGFQAGINKVNRSIAKTARKLRESSKGYQTWAAVGGTAAAAMATAMVKSQMSVMDNLAKTSDALKLQQERLQALQHVAELTGTGADKLSVNLERMQRRIGEIARKGGPAEQALTDIGLSAKEMISLSADQQLEKIAQAVGGIENASIRASIAQDLFGREGVKMLKMLEQLKADGLAPTVEELEQLGVSLSRIDTAKVEQANDAMFRMRQVFDGVVNKVAIKLAPVIEAVSNKFLSAAKDSKGFSDSVNSAFSGALKVVGVFANGIHGIQIIVEGLKGAFYGLAFVVAKINQGIAVGFETAINVIVDKLNWLVEQANRIPGVTLPAIEKFKSGAVDMFAAAGEEMKAGMEGAFGRMHELAMEPIPSEALEQFVADATAASEAAAKAATEGTPGGGGDSSMGLTPEERDALQARLDAINESLMTELELKREAHRLEHETLTEALAAQLITKEEFAAKEKELKQRQADELSAIKKRQSDKELALEKAKEQSKINIAKGVFGNLASLMNTNSKKLFKIGKAAAIANAVVSTYEAINKTMAATPYPWNIPLAAAQAAAGFANVQAIARQQPGGAGAAGATATFSGGLPAQRVTGGGAGGGGQPSQNISISLAGDSFSAGGVRGLIEAINGELGDGVQLGVTA